MSVSLKWDFLGSGVEFNVYRSTFPIPANNPGAPIVTGLIVAEYIDNDAPENTLVYYRVGAEKGGFELLSDEYQIETTSGGDICANAINNVVLAYDIDMGGTPPLQDVQLRITDTGELLFWQDGTAAAAGFIIGLSFVSGKYNISVANNNPTNQKIGVLIYPAGQKQLINPELLENTTFTFDEISEFWNGCLKAKVLTPNIVFNPKILEINKSSDASVKLDIQDVTTLNLDVSQGSNVLTQSAAVSGDASHTFNIPDLSVFNRGNLEIKAYQDTYSKLMNTQYQLPFVNLNDASLDGVLVANGAIFAYKKSSGRNDFIYRSTDGGETFQDITSDIVSSTGIAALLIESGGNLVFNSWTSPYKINVSSDSGTTWTQAATVPEGVMLGLTSKAASGAGRVVIALGSGGGASMFATSTDNGLTWSFDSGRSDVLVVYDMAYFDGMFYACGRSGNSSDGYKKIIISSSDGFTWNTEIEEAISNQFQGFNAILGFAGKVYATTYQSVYVKQSGSWGLAYSGTMKAYERLKIVNGILMIFDVNVPSGFMYSTDGVGFISVNNPANFAIFDIDFNGSYYTAAGLYSSSSNYLAHSSDLITWALSEFIDVSQTMISAIKNVNDKMILAGNRLMRTGPFNF